MTHSSPVLTFCAALALLSPVAVFAQSTTSGDLTVAPADADKPADAAKPTIEDQLSLGEDAQSAVGAPYTREEVGAWEIRCIRVGEGEEPCQMYQLLDDGEGSPVAEVSMFRLPDGGKAVAGATVIVPLETALPNQLTMSIDGGQARRYPYAFCNAVGCYARLGLTADDVTAFKRGANATLTIVPALALDQKVELNLSLDGFTASFDKATIVTSP